MRRSVPFSIWLLVSSLLLLVLGVVAGVFPVGAQSSACIVWTADGAVGADAGSEAACARAIADEGAPVGTINYGRWQAQWVAVSAEGNVYASTNGVHWTSLGRLNTAPAPQPADGDADGDAFADNVDACPNEPERVNGVFDGDGCPDDLSDLLTFAANDVDAFWAAKFADNDMRYYPPRRVSAYDSGGRGGGAYNAYYSRGTHSIAYDLRLMSNALTQIGDVAPVYIIAHEWGHLVQAQLGRLGNRYTIQVELEADCLAGAYLADLDARGLLESGDREEGIHQAYRVGDSLPWNHPGAHGTPEQRATALAAGLEGGVAACWDLT